MGTVSLDDLSVFVTVAETESFTAAAARLRLPKSSVSRAIARLEQELGTRVLLRTTRKVALSTAGKALHDKVRSEVISLRRSLGELPGPEEEPRGRLRLTAAPGTESYLAVVVERYVGRYRAVEVDLLLTIQKLDLVAEGIDLALRFSTRPLKDSSLTARKLATSTMSLFASPAYLARRGTPRTPRDLDRHEWVVYTPAPAFRLESEGGSASVVSRGRIACNDMAFLRAALVNGCGIGYLDPPLSEPETAVGRLVRVLPRWNIPISSLWAVWPGGRQPPRKVAAFLDLLTDVVKSRPI